MTASESRKAAFMPALVDRSPLYSHHLDAILPARPPPSPVCNRPLAFSPLTVSSACSRPPRVPPPPHPGSAERFSSAEHSPLEQCPETWGRRWGQLADLPEAILCEQREQKGTCSVSRWSRSQLLKEYNS
ncbi:hypothetical protein Q7C36_005750 [Tachysurus vachellii]|uniref:Uncharacterized protein n=1 Tax=Tachysurus vachellii TaxID=175792 RepID=A0AA88T0K9_TACVA|nr:hypothetical protein Q7C36_005750 [Tachysurus vachellii]